MNCLTKTILILSVIGVLLHATIITAQSTPDVRSLRVDAIQINKTQPLDCFRMLAAKYHIVIGISGTFTGADSRAIDVSVPEGSSFADALNSITAKAPQFRWQQLDNGSISVVVGSPLPLVDINVTGFSAHSMGRLDISKQLRQIPEVRQWLRSRSCTMDEFRMIIGSPQENTATKDFESHGQTFGAILTDVSKQFGSYSWSVLQVSARPCSIMLNPA